MNYALTLVTQAEHTGGEYHIDEEVIAVICRSGVPSHRMLAFNSCLLLRCQPSTVSSEWEGFLRKHAQNLLQEDRDQWGADRALERIYDAKRRELLTSYARRAPMPGVSEPGVHMFGFTRPTYRRAPVLPPPPTKKGTGDGAP